VTVHGSRRGTTAIPETCPHCGSRLKTWRVPDGTSWEEPTFLACFNDDCSYYVDGWTWMWEQFGQRASYRFAVNPRHGGTLMIPVWSAEATRGQIVDEAGEATRYERPDRQHPVRTA